jgi:hypothetical protein
MSQEFVGSSAIGNNSVIYIRNTQGNWPAPSILVYVPDGPQRITFTFETSIALASAVKVGMLISLVSAEK